MATRQTTQRALSTALLLAALVTSGCSSRGDSALPAVSSSGTNGEWLCEAGKAADDWDCIQSEDIGPQLRERAARARSSAADSLRAEPSPGTPPSQAVIPPDPKPIIDRDAASRGALKPDPAAPPSTPLATPPTQGRATSGSDQPLRTATNQNRQEPAYAQLAYRPKEPVRIIDLPENFFAAQLLAVSTKEQIENFVVQQDLYNMSAARIERDGQILYVLLLGVYESRAIAEQAIAVMPPAVRTMSPWVRPISGLQDAMIRADRAVATADIGR